MGEPSTYLVKEIFGPTIQGEGVHAGRACVFLRFAVCNLECSWCDTDFSPEGASELGPEDIVSRLVATDTHRSRIVVVTGGEPTLQWDADLAKAIKDAGFAVHMETNGTRVPRAPVDWLTVSPKPQFHRQKLSLTAPRELAADECKVVVDEHVDEAVLSSYEEHYTCDHWLLQPCDDGERTAAHLKKTLSLVERRPRWRVSLQLHKILGLP